MKIALIGDIHANLPALDAVLKDARQRGADTIWNVGDTIGYGAYPDEVVDLIRHENIQSILGNYDAKVLKVKQKESKWKKVPEKWVAFKWAYDNLSKANRDYLSSLPTELRFDIEGKRFLIVHGSPESDEEYILPDTPEERLIKLSNVSNADIIICGHSHQPFKKKFNNIWFINAGSVGRPDDGDPRASYAILQIKKPNLFQIRHYRIEYDIEKAIAKIRDSGLPEIFAQMIIQGRSLDTIKEQSGGRKMEESSEINIDKIDESISDDLKLEASIKLAKSCGYESEHTNQVINLSLKLFDELQSLHNLSTKERFWLHNAAILHDIGWIEGQKKHHKTALRIILEDPSLLLTERERLIVGSIARYHRAALPKKKHKHFMSLEKSERKIVKMLSAILRVADGLDRSHQSIVQDLSCDITQDQINILCSVKRPSEIDRQTALNKGDLMQNVFERNLNIEWRM
ncbi:MAG: metallophosphoesterase family protein [bacterium]